MSEPASQSTNLEPPAMGERRARWGYGYQDKVATERILNFLRRDLRDGGAEFEGVRLADLEAGRVDDFVLVWKQSIEGNSIKWSGDGTAFTWGELIGASGLLRDLAAGWNRLRARWPGRLINVRLQTNRPTSSETHHAQIVRAPSLTEFPPDPRELKPALYVDKPTKPKSHERCDRLMSQFASQWDDLKKEIRKNSKGFGSSGWTRSR